MLPGDATPAERISVAEHLIVLEVVPPRSPRSRGVRGVGRPTASLCIGIISSAARCLHT
jgi:hypothetical protein